MKKEEQKFISLAEAAKMTNYSQDYISLLCRQGKLKAEKLGRNWVTTKEWVYSYIDNTEGKGKTIVPVKIKGPQDAEDVKKNKAEKNELEKKKGSGKPFFSSIILECAVFCFASLFLLASVWGFARCQGEINSSTSQVQEDVAAQNALRKAAELNESQDTAAQAKQACPACIQKVTLPATIPFEEETDPAVLEKVKAQIEESFSSGKVDMKIYEKFAVVNYKSKPNDKFLYLIEE